MARPLQRKGRRIELAASLLTLGLFIHGAQSQSFSTRGPLIDPCAPLTAVKKGDNFNLGLMFLPGQNASALNNLFLPSVTTYSSSLGLCDPTVAKTLGLAGATFAVYSTRVDRLLLLQVPYSDLVQPMAELSSTRPVTMVMVAFRYNLFSTAVYVASANTTLTSGYGFVQTLSMMLVFSAGNLNYLNWYGTNCIDCGGNSAGICIHQPSGAGYSCSTPISNCTCSGLGIPSYACFYNSATFNGCNTGVNIAFQGTDSQNAAFTTGPQIQRLNSLSIVSLYYTVANYLSNMYNSTQSSISQQWQAAKGESVQQNVNQQGSLTGRRFLMSDPMFWDGLYFG
jgi:hypothetical protein